MYGTLDSRYLHKLAVREEGEKRCFWSWPVWPWSILTSLHPVQSQRKSIREGSTINYLAAKTKIGNRQGILNHVTSRFQKAPQGLNAPARKSSLQWLSGTSTAMGIPHQTAARFAARNALYGRLCLFGVQWKSSSFGRPHIFRPECKFGSVWVFWCT